MSAAVEELRRSPSVVQVADLDPGREGGTRPDARSSTNSAPGRQRRYLLLARAAIACIAGEVTAARPPADRLLLDDLAHQLAFKLNNPMWFADGVREVLARYAEVAARTSTTRCRRRWRYERRDDFRGSCIVCGHLTSDRTENGGRKHWRCDDGEERAIRRNARKRRPRPEVEVRADWRRWHP